MSLVGLLVIVVVDIYAMCHPEEPVSEVLLDVLEHPLLCRVRRGSSEVVPKLFDNPEGKASVCLGFAIHAN